MNFVTSNELILDQLVLKDRHTFSLETSPSAGSSLTVYTRMEAMPSTVGTATIATLITVEVGINDKTTTMQNLKVPHYTSFQIFISHPALCLQPAVGVLASC